MKKTVNTSHVRSINQRAVLDAIYQLETTSRAELARILNMSKPSMADNVADLLEIGIIREIGEGACSKGGGRKPVLLSFCDNFKYIIAMDFHYNNSLFALSNLKGEILNEFTIHQTPMSDFHSWARMCINAVAMLMSAQNITNDDLAAIAVSAPGILDIKENHYIVSSKFGEFNVAYLEEQLSQSFGAPILIKNSTNAAALGEFYYGAGMGCENMLYISCGQGVGAGLILGGKLYEGSHMTAGEFGYFVFPETDSFTGGDAVQGGAAGRCAADGGSAGGRSADGGSAGGRSADGGAAGGRSADGGAAGGRSADGRVADAGSAAGKEAGIRSASGFAAWPKKHVRLEDRISIDSILDLINAHMPAELARGQSPEEGGIAFPRMITLWEEGNPYIGSFVDKISYELGCAVCCLQSVFDCQKIILGGEYLAFARQLIPALQQLMDAHCPVPVSVSGSQMKDKGTVLGLITTCREFYFTRICSR